MSRLCLPRPIRPLGPPLPSSGFRGRPLREPCGSPPSSVLWATTTAPDPFVPLRSTLGATYLPPGGQEIESSLRFLDNPCGNMPRARAARAIRVPKHYIPYLFYARFSRCPNLMEKPPLLGQVADGRDGNVSCLLGVKTQASAASRRKRKHSRRRL